MYKLKRIYCHLKICRVLGDQLLWNESVYISRIYRERGSSLKKLKAVLNWKRHRGIHSRRYYVSETLIKLICMNFKKCIRWNCGESYTPKNIRFPSSDFIFPRLYIGIITSPSRLWDEIIVGSKTLNINSFLHFWKLRCEFLANTPTALRELT